MAMRHARRRGRVDLNELRGEPDVPRRRRRERLQDLVHRAQSLRAPFFRQLADPPGDLPERPPDLALHFPRVR